MDNLEDDLLYYDKRMATDIVNSLYDISDERKNGYNLCISESVVASDIEQFLYYAVLDDAIKQRGRVRGKKGFSTELFSEIILELSFELKYNSKALQEKLKTYLNEVICDMTGMNNDLYNEFGFFDKIAESEDWEDFVSIYKKALIKCEELSSVSDSVKISRKTLF